MTATETKTAGLVETSQAADISPAVNPTQPTEVVPEFETAVPLENLKRVPAPVDCPCCGERRKTITKNKIGGYNHAWAFAACACACLGCIPYLISSLKDVQHMCGNCNVLLATFHRSGTVDIHQYKQKQAQ